MSTDAISGVGTKVYFATVAIGPYTRIAEIPNVGGPNKTRSTIDVTDLDSEDGYREFIAGFRDSAEITFDMHFTDSGYTAMNDQFESDDLFYYKLVLPNDDQTIISFAGMVTNLGMNIPTDDKVTTPVTIKISGKASKLRGSSTTTTTS